MPCEACDAALAAPLMPLAFEHDAKDGRRDHADARRLLAGGALRAVPRGDVADLVADDARQVGFAIHIGHDAARDVHVAAGQREGIDVRPVEHREVPVELGAVRGLGQPLADFVDVGLHLGILVFAEFSEDLRVRFRPFGHLAALVHDRALGLAGDGVFDGRTTRKKHGGDEAKSNQKVGAWESPLLRLIGQDFAAGSCGIVLMDSLHFSKLPHESSLLLEYRTTSWSRHPEIRGILLLTTTPVIGMWANRSMISIGGRPSRTSQSSIRDRSVPSNEF